MATNIFVNLPVRDLKKSMSFFSSLGFTFKKKFTNENAACLVVSKDIFVMLVTRTLFATFTKRAVADASAATEVIVALSMGNREKVDEMTGRAVAAGGKIHRDPQDLGWMYAQCFEDPDGHLFEVFWMDERMKPVDPPRGQP